MKKDFQKSITHKDISLSKLLEVLNHAPAGVAFIIDDDQKLCGVVTDGDLRRWLLNGYNLASSLSSIELGNFVYAKEGTSVKEILKKTDKKIRLIPIVNKAFRIIDYFRFDQRINIPIAAPDLDGNELKYLTDAFLSTWISSSGAYINQFETQFSNYCSSSYGVATSNGTTALHLALAALDIGKGDEVIVPDLTFAATINAVLYTGATPVIVDIEEKSWCINPKEIEKAISPRTKAIIPVHLYGQPCDMDAIMSIARIHNLYVVEDCAEAHGASYKGQKVGSFGHINTFSFFANKIITTGEGGMCLTNDEVLNKKLRVLRDHGMNKQKRYWHDVVGFNYRMTNLQAALGCAQLERIAEILESRNQLEAAYKKSFQQIKKVNFQPSLPDRNKTVWLVSALYEGENMEAFIQFLKENKLDIRPFFYPLSQMPLYQPYVFSATISHQIAKKGFSLPTHKNLSMETITQILNRYEA